MNNTFVDGRRRQARVVARNEHVNLGLAVDVEKSDGSRTLLVPVHQGRRHARLPRASGPPTRTSSARSAPTSSRPTTSPAPPSRSPTPAPSAPSSRCPGSCPARASSSASAPSTTRPSTRAPTRARWPSSASRKVVTLTSTYDHRIIQGAESGLFLKSVHELLLGERRLLRRRLPLARRALRGRAVAPRRQPDRPRGGHARASRCSRHAHQHVPGARPPHRRPRPAAWQGAARCTRSSTRHLRAHHLGPRPRVPRPTASPGATRMPLGDILDVLRDAYCRTIGIEYMHIQEPDAEALDPGAASRASTSTLDTDEQRHILDRLNAAEAFEKFLATKYVGPKRFGLEGAESAIPMLDAVLDGGGRRRPRRGGDGHGPPRPPQRAGQHRRQELRADLPEFEGASTRTSVQGSGDVKYHLGPGRQVRRAASGATIDGRRWPPTRRHLEAVDPVVEGMVRAKQDQIDRARHATRCCRC